MKKLTALLLATSLSVSSAFAGGLAPVIVEDVPVVEAKPASSISPLLILGLLVLIGIAISQQDDPEVDP